MFSILIVRLFQLQIVKGQEYENNFILQTKREIVLSGARGNIYDRNGNPSYEKHKVFLYKEDFDKFVEGLEEAIGVVKAAINGELPEKNTDL